MKLPFVKKTDHASSPMSLRSKLGWVLVGMGVLVTYGIFRHFYSQDDSLFELNRTFVILFLLWLAWPELEALPRWILTLVPICAIVCAWRPQYLAVVIPISMLYLFLRSPGQKKKSKKSLKSSTLSEPKSIAKK